MDMTPTNDQADDPLLTNFAKWSEMDEMLLRQLDRMATFYELTPDACLRHLMMVQADREGTASVDKMVESAGVLKRLYKPKSKSLEYWQASKDCRQAVQKTDGLPGENSAYALMRLRNMENAAR